MTDARHPFQPAPSFADTAVARLSFVSAEERAALARVPVTMRSLGARDELVREGSMPENLCFLSTGWAFRYTTTRGGGRQVSAVLMPGGVCNLDTMMFERADFGVRTLTEAKVLMLPRHRALSLGAEYPGVGRAFLWLALAQNAILRQWAVGLGRRTAEQRLAHFLCEMNHHLGGGSSIELPLTQELMADALGLTSVHVNRTMQALRLKGLIAMVGRTLTILDRDRLRTVAEFNSAYLDQIDEVASPNRPSPTGAGARFRVVDNERRPAPAWQAESA